MIPTLTNPVKMPVVNTPPCLLSAQQPGESPSSPATSLPCLHQRPHQHKHQSAGCHLGSELCLGKFQMLDPFTSWNERAQRPETHVLLGSASPTSLPACTGAGPHFPLWGLGTHSVHYLLEQRHRWGAGVCVCVGGCTSCPTAPLFHLCISFQRMKSSQWPLLVILGVKTYLDPLVLGP